MSDLPPATPWRERMAVLALARAVDGGAEHGVRTRRAGRVLALLSWAIVLVAVVVLVLAWPRRHWLELAFIGVAVLGAWLAGSARFFLLAGAQWPVLSRYIDAEAVRRDAAALGPHAAPVAPATPLRRLWRWRWHARADLLTRLQRVSLAAAILVVVAVLLQLVVVPRAIAMVPRPAAIGNPETGLGG